MACPAGSKVAIPEYSKVQAGKSVDGVFVKMNGAVAIAAAPF